LNDLRLNLAEATASLGLPSRNRDDEKILSGINTDSRTIRPGELFVALRGDTFDGHDFLSQAFERGATAAVVASDAPIIRRRCLRVPDTLKALGDLAAYLRQRQSGLKVLAVTGSNGKTTTKEMLVRILSRKYRVLASDGNFNNLIGLPLTLFRLRTEHQVAVLEMGTNAPGEIARLTDIAKPDLALITNIGPAHLAGLGSIEGVARAKGELFAGLSRQATAIVNLDDPRVMAQAAGGPYRRLSFGFDRRAEVRVRGLRPRGLQGMRFDLVTPAGDTMVRMPLFGRHNVGNALAASACALALDVDQDVIADALQTCRPFPGRLELKRLPGPIHLLDDTYNSNPASTRAALQVLKSLQGRGRLFAALGDMLELGRASRAEHAGIGRLAVDMDLDALAAVGRNSKAMARAAEQAGLPASQVAWFPDTNRAAGWLRTRLRPHDRVLIKGSRGMHMETIVQQLTDVGKA